MFQSGLFMIRARENHENHRHSSASIATTRPNLPASDAPSSRSPGLSPVGASAVATSVAVAGHAPPPPSAAVSSLWNPRTASGTAASPGRARTTRGVRGDLGEDLGERAQVAAAQAHAPRLARTSADGGPRRAGAHPGGPCTSTWRGEALSSSTIAARAAAAPGLDARRPRKPSTPCPRRQARGALRVVVAAVPPCGRAVHAHAPQKPWKPWSLVLGPAHSNTLLAPTSPTPWGAQCLASAGSASLQAQLSAIASRSAARVDGRGGAPGCRVAWRSAQTASRPCRSRTPRSRPRRRPEVNPRRSPPPRRKRAGASAAASQNAGCLRRGVAPAGRSHQPSTVASETQRRCSRSMSARTARPSAGSRAPRTSPRAGYPCRRSPRPRHGRRRCARPSPAGRGRRRRTR